MTLLLDTHALLWWLEGRELADDVSARIADPSTLVAVSAASIWEAAVKEALGKLSTPEPLGSAAVAEGFEPLAVTFEHADRVGRLPAHHRDPFDRMLVAQAQVEGLTIVTRDPAFDAYEGPIARC